MKRRTRATTPETGPDLPGIGGAPVLTVSEVTRRVRQALAAAFPSRLLVAGEITNFKRHTSGHAYFTLKDAASEIACVMWRSAFASVKFRPADGLEVIVTGTIEVFEKSGRYQLYAQHLEPRGVGTLELALRQLREKLDKEGLFNPARKRPLPRFPRRIGIVTSPTGAALRDMLMTLERRYPCVEVLIFPVRVQGEGAAEDIAAGIRRINAAAASLGGVDLLIVGRGGGSIEDLWAFNEEAVVRAIHASPVPVISAVGHETDFTLADLAADVRAATPTAAAELAVPVRLEALEGLSVTRRRLTMGVRRRLDLDGRALVAVTQRPPFRDPPSLIRRREQLLDAWLAEALRTLTARLHERRRRLDRTDQALTRIAPEAFLAQGTRRLHERLTQLRISIASRLHERKRRLDHATHRVQLASPAHRLRRYEDALASALRRFKVSVRHGLDRRSDRVAAAEHLLNALSYRSVLKRGYSITRLKRSREVVRDAVPLREGDRLLTELAQGEVESRVVEVRQGELFES